MFCRPTQAVSETSGAKLAKIRSAAAAIVQSQVEARVMLYACGWEPDTDTWVPEVSAEVRAKG